MIPNFWNRVFKIMQSNFSLWASLSNPPGTDLSMAFSSSPTSPPPLLLILQLRLFLDFPWPISLFLQLQLHLFLSPYADSFFFLPIKANLSPVPGCRFSVLEDRFLIPGDRFLISVPENIFSVPGYSYNINVPTSHFNCFPVNWSITISNMPSELGLVLYNFVTLLIIQFIWWWLSLKLPGNICFLLFHIKEQFWMYGRTSQNLMPTSSYDIFKSPLSKIKFIIQICEKIMPQW